MGLSRERARASLFAAKAGESGLVLGVDGSGVLAASSLLLRGVTTTLLLGSTASLSTTTASLAATAAITASATALTTTATTSAASGALRLDEAGVKVDGLLGLALTLALGLAVGTGDEVLLLLLEGLGTGPLLVELAALVGLSDANASVESTLALGLLNEVLGVGDALVLGLLGLNGSGVLGGGILLLVLGDGFTGLLVLKLSVAFGGTPALGDLLISGAEGELVYVCPLERVEMTHTHGQQTWRCVGHRAHGGDVHHGLIMSVYCF